MTPSCFPNPIDGKFSFENYRQFTLDSDFVYDDVEKDIRVVVPAGFTTDFNSTPTLVWAYFAPWEYPEAGLVHDWLYRSPDAFGSTAQKPPMTRQQADDVHRRILHLRGCRMTKRNIVYAVLRLVGGVVWNRYRALKTTT